MDANTFRIARKTAEKVVADMVDGALKTKAFEVVFSKLLENGSPASADAVARGSKPIQKSSTPRIVPRGNGLKDRILSLKDDNFFKPQRTLGEVRDELGSRGWHHPLTALSGPMQSLVQDRELRRQRVNTGTKKVWKYSNY